MLMILLAILSVIRHPICGNSLNWLLNLNVIYEILWTGVKSGLLISLLGKFTWFWLAGQINNNSSIDMKMEGSVLEENQLLSCWGWVSLLNWIGVLTLSLLVKLPPRKLELYFILGSFFPLRLLCISINLPDADVWNSVVMPGLVPLIATWNC